MDNHPIAFFFCLGNDMFHAQQLTSLLSGKWNPHLGDVKIYNATNSIRRSVALFSARSLPKHTWINDNNRYLGKV